VDLNSTSIVSDLVALATAYDYTMKTCHLSSSEPPPSMQAPVLIALISTGVFLTGVLVYAIWQKRRHAQRVDRLESQASARLDELGAEHEQRVQRLTREWEGQRKRAHLALARDLLPAIDAVESALASADRDDEITRGVELIRGELLEAFRAHDIERLAPEAGTPFDPNVHEAVDLTEPSDETPEGTVAACHRAGYRHPDAVLRPAMVTVARDRG
ncbi:MAG: nucleotide exchange factor GrpE, partial [Myxococcota bacterium]